MALDPPITEEAKAIEAAVYDPEDCVHLLVAVAKYGRRSPAEVAAFLDRQLDCFERQRTTCRNQWHPQRCGCEHLVAVMNGLEREIAALAPPLPGLERERERDQVAQDVRR